MNNSSEINRLSGTPSFKPALPPHRPGTINFRGRGVGIGVPSSDRPVLPAPKLPPCPPAKPLSTQNLSTAQAPSKPMEQPPSPPKPLPQVPPFRNTNNQNQDPVSQSTVIIIPNGPSLQPTTNTAEIIAKAESIIDKAASVGFKNQELACDLLEKAADLYMEAASSSGLNQLDYLKIAACLYAIAQDYLTYLGRTISKEFEALERKRFSATMKVHEFDGDWNHASNRELTNLKNRVWLVDTSKIKKESKFSKIGNQLKKNSSSLLKGASKKIDSVSKAAQKNLSAAFATPLSIDQKATQLENSADQAEQEGRLADAFHLRHQIAKLYAEHKGMLDESNPSITICLSRAVAWYDSLIPQIRHLPAQEKESMHAIILQQTQNTCTELKTRPDVVYEMSYLEEEVKKDYHSAQLVLEKMVRRGTLLDEGRVSILMSYYYLNYKCPSYYEKFKHLADLNAHTPFFDYWNDKRYKEFRDQSIIQLEEILISLNEAGEIDLPNAELQNFSQASKSQSFLIRDHEKFKQTMDSVFARKYTELHADWTNRKMDSFEKRLFGFETALLQASHKCYLKNNFVYAYLYLEIIVDRCRMFQAYDLSRASQRLEMASEYAGYLQELAVHFFGEYQILRQQKIMNILEEIPKSRAKIAKDYEDRAEKLKKEKLESEKREREYREQNFAMQASHAKNMANIYASMPKPVCYTGNSVYGLMNGGMGGVRWV